MTRAALVLERAPVLAHRRRATGLDERGASGPGALRRAAWAGLQDSMPRAATLSLHARVTGVTPDAWEDPALVQLWGPRFSAYVVPAEDRAPFTLGRLPDDGPRRRRAEAWAARVAAFLDGRRMRHDEAAQGMGVRDANLLRYAAPTGTLLIRWDGARQPEIWSVPPPPVTPREARLELARRYLHVLGPGTATSFAAWAGVVTPQAHATFADLGAEVIPVATPVGDAWILAADEASFRADPSPAAPARLLPSGDPFFLLWGTDRELLVQHAAQRAELWTSRAWPGAIVLGGEVAGTWRRAGFELTAVPWRAMKPDERAAIDAEAARLPLPGLAGGARVRWMAP